MLKAWLIQVGADGEWPLFLDVFVEHVVEEVTSAAREGSKGTIEGPFYAPGAPEFGAEATLPMRDGEPGTPLVFHGQVRAVDGTPLAGAEVDIWHCDDDGYYAQFAPGIPEWNLRGRILPADGRFRVSTPSSPRRTRYRPTGPPAPSIRAALAGTRLRPAHLHMKVSSHPGYQLITTQLYFPGDPHNEDDIASAVVRPGS